ncbi:MAG: SGNH/GDSL hydrolase family protein [Verrucomicrobia bacterium]|nr:SGNH/GDSL hydrolase family protein [Verrucomicrobiota bacterium]
MVNKTATATPSTAPQPVASETRFVNAMRLSTRQWLAVAVVVSFVLLATPWLWKKTERFETSADYRIPYSLSKDYWLYERRLGEITPTNIAVIGDSVIWGEYVRPDGALPHFLNEQSSQPGKFVNTGVNGLFPLAFEGLIRDYGEPLRHRKVILHCNVLWMSSPKADLHTEKEERFNHADLVPQFSPRIPCYKADLNRRLAAVVERHFTFSQWANHLQVAYFGQKNILAWTLEEDSSTPPRYPNAYKNPFAQITLTVPTEPATDPERGPTSPRHKPWSTTGEGSTRFEWVELDQSLQWAAFQGLVKLLQSRDNDVLVLLGPFNEQIMADENRAAFRRLRDGIAEWLTKNQVPHVVPATLPGALYADASHPLTEGYQLLADRLYHDATFQQWLTSK